MTFQEIEKLLDKKVSEIAEFVEVVVIIGSFQLEGSTYYVSSGSGNHYAREAIAEKYARRSKEEIDPEPDDPDWKSGQAD